MKRLVGIAFVLCLLSSQALAVCPATLQLKDNAGVTPTAKYSDDGSGNCMPNVVVNGSTLPAGASTAANQASQITQETATAGAVGTTTDAVAATPASGTAATMIALLKAILNTAAAAIAAGTNYIGQIGAWVAPTSYVSGTTAAMTGTTSTQLLAAVVSKKLYVLSISCVNSHATVGTLVTVQDGSGGTALATLAAAAVFGGDEKTSVGPLFSTTSGNALFVADVTTGANVICNASGFAQ